MKEKRVKQRQRRRRTNWKVFTDARACDRQTRLALRREYKSKDIDKNNDREKDKNNDKGREKDKTKTMKKTNQLESAHGCKSM